MSLGPVSVAKARALAVLPGRDDLSRAGREPRRDLVAGATVAVVALPLALAFGVASGMGARAGLVTAIVAGALAAIFGGSNLQVSGPTGAMTVVLIPVVHRFGADGVLMVGVLAGLVLTAASLARVGGAARYLPAPVIEGFTAGIAVVIVLQQVPAFLGVAGQGDQAWRAALSSLTRYLRHPDPWPVGVGLLVATIILGFARWRPGLPVSLAAVGAVSALCAIAHVHVRTLGALPSGLPGPSLGFFHPGTIAALLPSALAVAALAALESLLCASVADGMSVDEHHDPDRELFGQGIANLIVPLFGGVPATAAIARTAVNVRAGATSRLAALTHAVLLALVVLVIAPLVGHIPLAALAGVLIGTCIQMVEVASIAALTRASRSDAVVLMLTLAITIAFNLITAVAVGIGVAIVFALRSVAADSRVEQIPASLESHDSEERALRAEHIVAYRLEGPLFFAAAHRFLLELTDLEPVKVIILRLSHLTSLDTTGAKVLDDAITRLEKRGVIVLLSGARPHHSQLLTQLGVTAHLEAAGRVFADTPQAIAHAHTLI